MTTLAGICNMDRRWESLEVRDSKEVIIGLSWEEMQQDGETLEGEGSGLVITVGGEGEVGEEEIFILNHWDGGGLQRGDLEKGLVLFSGNKEGSRENLDKNFKASDFIFVRQEQLLTLGSLSTKAPSWCLPELCTLKWPVTSFTFLPTK